MKVTKTYIEKLIKEELKKVLTEDDFLRDTPEEGLGLSHGLPKSEKIDLMRKYVSDEGGVPVVDASDMNHDDILAMTSVLDAFLPKGWYETTGAKFVNVSQQSADNLKSNMANAKPGEFMFGGKQEPSTFDKLANI